MGKSEQAIFRAIPKIQEATVKSMKEILDAILALAAQQRDNELVQLLLEHEKAGKNVDFEICRGFAYKDFEKKLSDSGVPHAIFYDQVSGSIIMATRDIDREQVAQLKNELFVEQGRVTRLDNKEFARLYSEQKIETMCNLTVTEAKVFTQLAKQHGLVMTVKLSPDNPSHCDVAYGLKDKEKAQKVLNKTMMMTTGQLGKLQELQCKHEIQFQKDILSSVQDPQKELYVVSKTNPKEYVHFNKDGMEYYKNSVLVRTISRGDEHFVRGSMNYVSGMVNPVTLAKKEFEVSEREKLANIKAKSLNIPKLERDTRKEDLERMARQLVELKMSLDNSDMRSVPANFYDSKVSFEEFVRIENINDDKSIEFIKELDQLHQEEKILVKDYIKDVADKVESIRIYEAYISPDLDDFIHTPTEQVDINEIEVPFPDDRDAPFFDASNDLYDLERE